MRDGGLVQAIEAIGGVGALARALGISQPSVSNWIRVPAERVLSVELLTGVPRSTLRPDLYPAEHAVGSILSSGIRSDTVQGAMISSNDVDPIDRARAEEYLLLAMLLRAAPAEAFLERIGQLSGDDSALGQAHAALATAARRTDADDLETEFFDLFVGVGRGELLPYASYYLTGFLNERPLAKVREDMARLGIARSEQTFDPEDHVATLLEIVAGLMLGLFDGGPAEADRFRDCHLMPWAPRFFADLARAKSATFYRAVGELGRIYLEIEAEASALD